MHALNLYAGPAARGHIEHHGLSPGHVGVIPAAAGGPKGLILGPLDRFIFGQWLPQSAQTVHLVGASIGAWRMATACMHDPAAHFQALETGYIHGDMTAPPGRKLPLPEQVSATFARNLREMFDGHVPAILRHPRYRLHVVTSRGRHVLGREGRLRTAAGYLGAALTNAASRRAMGSWIERVVFSGPAGEGGAPAPLPFDTRDYRTRQVLLTPGNFYPALQASGSIPFVLQAVHDIPGAPRGAYWDGGITDYHLHLIYNAISSIAAGACTSSAGGQKDQQSGPIVLYPHFQQAVVPGWLDKPWKRRHGATPALDHMLLLAPNPEWVRTLPGGKLPDRNDFQRLAHPERVQAWTSAVQAARQLADEFAAWLAQPEPARVQPL
ncbi:phospholipase [Ottowia testudinis]|uniref:Phospholipase n=1 Tax=Ottowia testudinis TaxID=2816950 RepID=A0A975H596_9BURK|nr:phospholipase [Ottowia testudinis]QTD47146.1 phospholipase [Ottowia testudinis]